MPEWLKRGSGVDVRLDADRAVRGVVEGVLSDIGARGDAAVRELSVRFDGWDRDDYRLSDREKQDCLDQLSGQALKDIEFAQAQIRNFAEIQRASIGDVEVETMPGVVLGHRTIPVSSAGCYVPGGKYPLLASSPMSVITAKVAGVPRVIPCPPPFQGQPAAAIVAAPVLAGADDIYCPRGIQAVGARALGNQSLAPADTLFRPRPPTVPEHHRHVCR